MLLATTIDIPRVGVSTEGPDSDFKVSLDGYRRGDGWKAFEMAKDIAAFANGTGGRLFIGVAGSRSVASKLVGVGRDEAHKAIEAFERAARDRCRPSPLLRCELAQLPDDASRVVLIVSVWPSASVPVGVQRKTQDFTAKDGASGDEGKFPNEAWLFPVRVGSETLWLAPDQFGTVDGVTRRIAAQLASIPSEEREQILLRARLYVDPADFGEWEARLVSLSIQANAAAFEARAQSGEFQPLTVPLDWIAATWKDARWHITLSCVLRDTNRRFVPLPHDLTTHRS